MTIQTSIKILKILPQIEIQVARNQGPIVWVFVVQGRGCPLRAPWWHWKIQKLYKNIELNTQLVKIY